MNTEIRYLTDETVAPGEVMEIVEGVFWLRMPLPFQLDHINLWLIEDFDGWTLIDTGINNTETKSLWIKLLPNLPNGGRINRLICTHAHPDHMGLAGWFCDEFGLTLNATKNEWDMGVRLSRGRIQEEAEFKKFFKQAGCSTKQIKLLSRHLLTSNRFFHEVPINYIKISDKNEIRIGRRSWNVIVGKGHSAEHACLYCGEIDVLIGGDQILPKITPTIILHTYEPNGNPLLAFLDSNKKFKSLGDKTRVLPSHNRPFVGLQTRLIQYEEHHFRRLEQTYEACKFGATAIEVARILFTEKPDPYHLFFSVGEALAHLRYLEVEGRLIVRNSFDDVVVYLQAS